MPYIIENTMLFENEQIQYCNLVVKNDKIYSRDVPVRKMKFIRLNMDKHLIMATGGMVGSLEQWKKEGLEYAKSLVMLGVTTVVFPVDVLYDYQLKANFQSARAELSSFPLDYVLVLRIPLSLLKPKLIRMCRLLYIPACIVVFDKESKLRDVSWSGIREVSFPYKLAFIPQCEDDVQLKEWREQLEDGLIPYYDSSLPENTHIPMNLMRKIGIYPHKGILRSGGEVSYNVLKECDKEYLMNQEQTYYDKIEYTVFKNKVIRMGQDVSLAEIVGEELVIKVPGFFQ